MQKRQSKISIQSDSQGKYIVENFYSNNPKALIIGVPGFGMNRYDGHDLFRDIADYLVDYNVTLIDLNHIDENGLTANPLSVQVDRFNKLLADTSSDLPIILIGHSMGCIVISKSQTSKLRSIFTAPAIGDILSILQTALKSRKGTTVDGQGTWQAKRSDGSTSKVPAKFWEEIQNIDLLELYRKYLEKNDTDLIIAAEDQILKKDNPALDELEFTSRQSINQADHDLSGPTRAKLLEALDILLSD